ncbi:MAG: pilus assembly protein PilM [Candidatus Hydrogenedentales bacterium]|jgi:hypothetical protein
MKLPAKIGAVEFDDDEIRLAVVNTGGRVPSILDVSVCRAVYESASERFEALVAAVKHARAQLKAKPSAWVVCAGSDNAIARKLVLPFKGRGKVAAAVPFELEPYLAFPIDELAVDYSIIREADGNTEVLAVGVRRTLLEEQLDVLSAGGITAEGIGLDAAGLSSLLRACQGGTAGLTAALHAREYGASLVVTRGTALVYLRHLPLTSEQLRQEPAGAAREVQNTLRAFLASWPEDEAALSELTVTGLALPEAQREEFEQELALPVHQVDLLEGMKDSVRARIELPAARVAPDGMPVEAADESAEEVPAEERPNAWAVLAGVALTSAGGTYGLNFRTGPLAAASNWSGLLRHGIFSMALAAVLLVAFGVHAHTKHLRNRAEIERIGNAIWAYYEEAFPASPSVEGGRPAFDTGGSIAIEMMRADHSAMSETLELSDVSMYQRPPLPDILREISIRMPDSKVRVTSVRIASTQRRGDLQSITIEGEVIDPGAFDDVMAALQASEFFKQVENPQRRGEGGKTTFSVRAYI